MRSVADAVADAAACAATTLVAKALGLTYKKRARSSRIGYGVESCSALSFVSFARRMTAVGSTHIERSMQQPDGDVHFRDGTVKKRQ
jgi:hypothetical protein